MKKKKLLVIYAPYGSGHKSIANYIGNYFTEVDNDWEVKILDVAKYAKILGKITIKAFDFVINHRTNHLFSFIYDITNNKLGTTNQMKIARKAFDNEKIRKEIIGYQPDLTIATHFYGSNLVSYYNKLGFTNSKIMTVITDYRSHSYWQKYHEDQDAFIVANDIVKQELIDDDIPENKIYAFGLPFNRKNEEDLISKEELYYRFSLDANKKTFLFFGGGSSGSMINYEYLKRLIKKNFPINIIFIAGKNQKLENKCRSYIVKHNVKNVKILGFTKDVLSILNISDVCITKPGGATITECIDMKVPLILIPGNGGPEKYNARFIKKKKYGVTASNLFWLIHHVKKIVNNNYIIENWKNNLNKEKTNEATKKIYELSVKLIK